MRITLLVSAILLGAVPTIAASLIHDYQFQNSLADSLGGPSLTSLGGTVGAGEYAFGAQQGLSLSGALTASQIGNYSIYMDFEFNDLSGYKKIVDFKNLASDNGLYNLSSDLNYYNFSFGADGAFTAGSFAQVVLTRDSASGLVTGYVNGLEQIQFTDTTSDAVFNAANNVINFFQDDNVTGGRESTSGAVSEIRIYDGALTASQVAALTAAPEPMSLVLTGAGLLLCIARGRKLIR